MAEAGGQVLVLLAAVFLVPQLMKYMPDFDPLLMIVGLFGVIALVQQLGFQLNASDSAGDSGAARDSTGRSPKAKRREEERAADEKRSSSPSDLMAEAARCLEQNNWSRAQDLAKQATDLDPENALAWEQLATAQKWQGKRAEAAATVKKARDLYEADSPGLRKLAADLEEEAAGTVAAECQAKGEDFFGRRQYDLAVECFSKALEALGEGEGGGGGEASGEENAQAAKEMKDRRLALLRRRAECAQQLQDWCTCRSDASAVLQATPGDARALLQRAAANEALEKFKAALEDARSLLAINPKNSAANRIVHNCQQALRS